MRVHIKKAIRLLFLTGSCVMILVMVKIFISSGYSDEKHINTFNEHQDDFLETSTTKRPSRLLTNKENPEESAYSQLQSEIASPGAISGQFKFQFQPFQPGIPKFIVILTYQRCGSSAVGQFFNSNPDIFYYFEPLDSLYSSLYGVRHGWSIPSDITSYPNGTEREIPYTEIEAITHFLNSLFSCDIDSLPTDTLIHRYLFTLQSDFAASHKYISCLFQRNLNSSNCEEFTAPFCGQRFGQKSERVLKICRNLLQNPNANIGMGKYISRKIRRNFTNYRLCMSQMRLKVEDYCLPIFQVACSSRKIRVVKLVRATMSNMEPFLRTIPNFRVIHLIRDPRAVAISRKKFDASARGLYSTYANNSMINEAIIYCRDVVRDIKVRRELEALYPGKVYTVIHEEIFTNVVRSINDIYRFIDHPVSNNTWDWMELRRFMSKGLYNWQDELTFQESKEIFTVCREFFQMIRSDKWSF